MKENNSTSGRLEEFGIDRFMDKVSKSKVARAILGITTVVSASTLLSGCNESNPPPAETAPLPSGTATADNPFVEVTEIPTSTSIPTEIPTATIMPTATEMVSDSDIEKMSHSPSNIEELNNNRNEYLVSPFDPSVDYDGFVDWYSALCLKLGDFSKMQVNFTLDSVSIAEGQIDLSGRAGESMKSQPLFFAVQIGDTLYPAYIVVSEKNGNVQRPLTVIMIDIFGNGDFSMVNSAMDKISNGGGELKNIMVRTEASSILPNKVDSLIAKGLNGSTVGEGFAMGFGVAYFRP